MERIRHGYKIAEDCYLAGGSRNEDVVEFKERKLRIYSERFPGKPSMIIYPEKDRKWLPPHENEIVSDADYKFIINAVAKHFEKHGEEVKCQW